MLRLVIFCALAVAAFGKYVPTRRELELDYSTWQNGGRVIGGRPADEGEYPSQASLKYGGLHNCGCSIISEKFILTAAHCVRLPLPGLLSVQVGSNQWNNGGVTHEIVNIIDHPGFNFSDFSSEDIALIEVTPDIVFNNVTKAASLPYQDQETLGGIPAIIVGWGLTQENGTLPPINLMEGDVVVRDQQECYDIYAADVQITPAQICADVPEGGVGICSGDSGGPLYADNKIVGLSSWSANGCAAQGYPGVFTRVASYRNWIFNNSGV